MAANPQLVKDWIQYLKNNRIVAMQSDPKTGQLKYRRPATTADLKTFLNTTGQYDEEVIDKAIASVTGGQPVQPPAQQKKPGERKVSMRSKGAKVFRHIGKQLGESQEISFKQIYEDISQLGSVGAKRAAAHQKQDVAKNYGASVKGGDYSDKIKNQPEPEQKKPEQQPEKPQDNVFKDQPSAEIHEKDVEKVFAMLGAAKGAQGKQQGSAGAEQGQKQQNPEKEQAKKNEELNRIKLIIRDTMTPQQRKTFYRALSDTELSESLVNKADIKHIFQTASQERSSMKSRLLRKNKISVADLQQAWKDEGFPDDTRDIVRILEDQGFGDKEIAKVMSSTFGAGDEKGEAEQPVASPAIQKIADIAIERGYAEDLKKFMEKEFKGELGISSGWSHNLGKAAGNVVGGLIGKRKATTEDIRQIFEHIILEERTERTRLIKEYEQTNLGRNKKSTIVEQDLDVGDVLKPNQVVDLLKSLKLKIDPEIDISSVGSQIIQSWQKGLKSRKHYDDLLSAVHLKISDLID